MRIVRVGGAAALSLALCGCGPVMEANRPDPVDLSQFKPGEKRLEVVKVIGAPPATVPDGGKSCDVYKLYTHGPSSAGRAAAAFGEGVTDVFTLGLAEVIWTPVEAGTKNSLYTVTFCYQNEALVSVEEQKSSSSPEPAAPAAVSASSPMPSPDPTAQSADK
jgi:hypothetical protein